MRRSLWILTWVAAGFVALASPALAQERGARMRMHDPEKRIEELDEALDLTDAQETELRTILAEQSEKGRELREARDREAMVAHMRETQERIMGVLTDEQRQKFDALQEEHRARRHEMRDGERRHAPGERQRPDDSGTES
jgi:Spy/CpxP family protein refolding chaperone